MRKLGIVGGTSWSSTALYYEAINRGVAQRLGGLHSARLAIESLDLAPVAEWELSDRWDRVADALGEAAQRLEGCGAEAILLASNTSHKVFDEVAERVAVPLLHIGDATARRLVADGVGEAALLGTRFTMTGPHIRNRLEGKGIRLVALDPEWMVEIDRIIFDELAAGRVEAGSRAILADGIAGLEKRGTAVILGCTELVLAVDPGAHGVPVYDTTAIHAAAAVDWMLDGEKASA